MTRKTRRLIFYFFLITFLIISYLITVYSRGWRFDFEKMRFVEIGAIYLKTQPPGVKIYLNNKFKKETRDFPIFSSALFKNLKPGYYKIKVEKDGYFSWQKTLLVESRLVTEAKDIQLFLKNPIIQEADFSEIKRPDKLTNFYFKKNGLFYKKEAEQEIQLTIVPIKLPGFFEIISSVGGEILVRQTITDKNLYFFNKDKRILEKIDQRVINAQFSRDGTKFLYENENEIFVYFLNSGKKELITRSTDSIKAGIWFNQEATYLAFLSSGLIQVAELDDRDQRNIIGFLPSDGDFLHFDADSQRLYFLIKNNLYKAKIQ